jgi:hypothetical protein
MDRHRGKRRNSSERFKSKDRLVSNRREPSRPWIQSFRRSSDEGHYPKKRIEGSGEQQKVAVGDEGRVTKRKRTSEVGATRQMNILKRNQSL